jgi:hypothetical protein
MGHRLGEHFASATRPAFRDFIAAKATQQLEGS